MVLVVELDLDFEEPGFNGFNGFLIKPKIHNPDDVRVSKAEKIALRELQIFLLPWPLARIPGMSGETRRRLQEKS
jgi:hypothetical protein